MKNENLIDKLTKEQANNLLNNAKKTLGFLLKEDIRKIKENLGEIKKAGVDLEHHRRVLNLKKSFYKEAINHYKKDYGLEFPEIERQYNKMLPEINQYLNVPQN
jgi:septation ring formation regulator EzrA